jgi:transglutaminase-like putative cysteine protease
MENRPLARGRQSAARRVGAFLEPDRLVPVTGVPAQLAAQETKGATTPLEKAKDIYEYVFRTMKYDKSGTGWGHGDTLWACDAKHGNCTDFHSVFISMARAEKIPARFQIGFPLPADKHSAEIPGIPLLGGVLSGFNRLGSGRYFGGLEASGKARLLFRRARCKPGAVHAGTRSETRPRAERTAAELFCLSVRGDRRKGISQCFDRVLV